MLHSFDEMPDSSRMWIYQADRPFTTDELLLVEQEARNFVNSWAAHGQSLRATYRIEHNQFILLAVDENYHPASGCSIDDSVRFIRNIEQKTGVELLNRSNVALYKDGKVEIQPLKAIKSSIEKGEIDRETLVFNGFINNLKDFRNSWTQPAEESWMSKYFV
mgnify:CR=1 FL=1|tara:strand:- start:244 stop:729 length:486 start_codon:yes stop_codon:yes gene_type:complete